MFSLHNVNKLLSGLRSRSILSTRNEPNCSELEKGQARLQRLRVEASQRLQKPSATAPARPPHWVAELQWLQSLVALNWVRGKRGLGRDKWKKSSRISNGRSTFSLLPKERKFCHAKHHNGSVGREFNYSLIDEGELVRGRMEATRISG